MGEPLTAEELADLAHVATGIAGDRLYFHRRELLLRLLAEHARLRASLAGVAAERDAAREAGAQHARRVGLLERALVEVMGTHGSIDHNDECPARHCADECDEGEDCAEHDCDCCKQIEATCREALASHRTPAAVVEELRAKGVGARCRSEFSTTSCDLADGHEGCHRSGPLGWTDTVRAAPAPPGCVCAVADDGPCYADHGAAPAPEPPPPTPIHTIDLGMWSDPGWEEIASQAGKPKSRRPR